MAEVLFLPAAAVVFRTFPGNTNREKTNISNVYRLKNSVNKILMHLYLKVKSVKVLGQAKIFLFFYFQNAVVQNNTDNKYYKNKVVLNIFISYFSSTYFLL